jgi:hypothetical protein
MTTSEVVSGLVLAAIEGAVLFIVDCKVGVRAYRWWHDLTHREPLPADVEQGFVVNRKANARFTAATLVALAQSGVGVAFGASPFTAMLTIALQVPVLMAGFYLGPALRRLWRRKDPLLAVVDKLESGETSIGAEVKRASTKVAGALRREELAAPLEVVPLEAPPLPPAEVPVPAPEPEPDPVEAMRRFTKRQQ